MTLNEPIQLDNQEENFLVDGRYKIIVNIKDNFEAENQDIIVDAKLIKNSNNDFQECVESDESLAMLGFC